jgi:Rod binding domain-containing protein
MDVSALASKPIDTSRQSELKKVFNEFTAGTFYREMLAAMRKGASKPAYFDGGQAEEIFRGELDRHIADDLVARQGEAFSAPLFKNFSQQLLTAPRG